MTSSSVDTNKNTTLLNDDSVAILFLMQFVIWNLFDVMVQ